jgi:hypothetical protein
MTDVRCDDISRTAHEEVYESTNVMMGNTMSLYTINLTKLHAVHPVHPVHIPSIRSQ